MRGDRVISAVEVHAEGEGGRVGTAGMPRLPWRSVSERMQFMQTRQDGIRKLILREPRGNVQMVDPVTALYLETPAGMVASTVSSF